MSQDLMRYSDQTFEDIKHIVYDWTTHEPILVISVE